MEQSLCKLTLVCPPDGSDRVVELMLTIDPPIEGFTTWSAEGHGHGFEKASFRERVRGRVDRTMLVAVVSRFQVAKILETIATRATIPHMAYWIEPIEAFGRLAPASIDVGRATGQAGREDISVEQHS